MKLLVAGITGIFLLAHTTTNAMQKGKEKRPEKTFSQHWENEVSWLAEQVGQASQVILQSHNFKGCDPKQTVSQFLTHLIQVVTIKTEAQRQESGDKHTKSKAAKQGYSVCFDFYLLENFFHANYVCQESEARTLLDQKIALEKEKQTLAVQLQRLTCSQNSVPSNQAVPIASQRATPSEGKQELQEIIRGLEKNIADLTRQLETRAQKIATLETDLDKAHTVPSEQMAPSTAFTAGIVTGAAAGILVSKARKTSGCTHQ